MLYCEAALEAAEVYGRRLRPPPSRRRTVSRCPPRRRRRRSAAVRPAAPVAAGTEAEPDPVTESGADRGDPDLPMRSEFAARRTQQILRLDSETDSDSDDDGDGAQSDGGVADPTPRPEYVILARAQSETGLQPRPAPQAVLAPYQAPTVAFPYPPYVRMRRPGRTGPVAGPIRFKVEEQVPDYQVLTRVALAAGLRPTRSTARCNLFWGRPLAPDRWELLTVLQKVNHFPGSHALSRKDKLAVNLAGPCSEFLPETYVLPGDRLAFQRAAAADADAVWIQKPYASSCGRGIRLIDRFSQLGARSKSVISRYIERPYLIDGHKFDLRLYFVVTCLDPLRIYTLDDGLVRFATQRYSLQRTTFAEKCVHLTNFAVNRRSKNFVPAGAAGDRGSKWSYKALLAHLGRQHGPDAVAAVRDRIHDLGIRAVIAVEHIVFDKMRAYRCPRTACFEVFGFDVLLDADLRPWLLEVNAQPSLGAPSPLDKFIKTKLMADVFHLIGLPASENDLRTIRRTQMRRLKRVIGLRKPEAAETGARPVPPPLHMSPATLSDRDLQVLREAHAEAQRCGHLVRIFPTGGTERYQSLFHQQRYNNVLLQQWLALPRDHAQQLIQ